MKFKIAIGSNSVHIPSSSLGLDFLDKAREASGVSNLKPELVEEYLYQRTYVDPIYVSEAVARASGHFQESCEIFLRSPSGFLNRFYSVVPVVERDETTGEVKRVRPQHHFNCKKFLQWWREHGYPLALEQDEA